jgi:ABC-type glycerol-3-phosphate transport system substrate-binding protein
VLYPYDSLTSVLDDPDWYEYARQLSFFQNATFGIPFAGDALVMAYHPDMVPVPPIDWISSLAITSTLTFPAADPNAIFTFAQYQSLNAPLTNENGQPFLDVIQLTQVLSFYQQASTTELMPFWLTQFETDNQSWEAFENSEADMAITWASRYLQSTMLGADASAIPTQNGQAFTLADGWVWALTTNDPDRQLLSAQLVEFLTTSDYLAEWTETAGYLPPRQTATDAWRDASQQAFISLIAASARVIPPVEVVAGMGPVLQQATVSVLKAEAAPDVAAQTAVEKLNDLP